MKAELFISNLQTIYSFDLLLIAGDEKSGLVELKIRNQSDDIAAIEYLKIHMMEFLIGWRDGSVKPSRKKNNLKMRAPKSRSFVRFEGYVSRVDRLEGNEYRVQIQGVRNASQLPKR